VRVVFLGSGRFAIPSLLSVIGAGHQVVAVVTQPDREQGRGRSLAPPPLKPVALERGLPVLQPPRVKSPDALAELEALRADVQVVVAYGQILPRRLIDAARLGTVNVHASLLPRYRGAAPIQWALVNGETQTGVTTMLIDEGLDTGPTLLARATPIGPTETADELEARLAALGGELLAQTLRGLEDGSLKPTPQDPARATLAPLIRKQDGRLDWNATASALANRLRGFTPWPGLTARLAGRAVKLIAARAEGEGSGEPGEILACEPAGLLVACGGGTRLRISELQPESRRPMAASAFAAGARLAVGQRFE